MAKKAVDIVLLPEEAVMDLAIEANGKLVEKFGDKIVLNKDNCLPHISLAMGCIDESDITEVSKLLEKIAKEMLLGELKVVGILTTTNAVGEKVSAFVVDRTGQLRLLHEQIMKELSPYSTAQATAETIADDKVDESTLLWINSYREKSSFENFFPHITIGYGQTGGLSAPAEFVVSQLALCHLGNHCTCRKVFVSISL